MQTTLAAVQSKGQSMLSSSNLLCVLLSLVLYCTPHKTVLALTPLVDGPLLYADAARLLHGLATNTAHVHHLSRCMP